MRKNFIYLAAAFAFTAAGCATTSEETSPVTGMTTPETASGYVQMAGASDLFEIQSSQLALTRAQEPSVRQFAQTMITHHTQTTQQLTQAARTAGITPNPTLLPMHTEMMQQLERATGSEFDRMYVQQQIRAHEAALALHSNYARSGETPALRTVAAAATPIVTQHLAEARNLGR